MNQTYKALALFCLISIQVKAQDTTQYTNSKYAIVSNSQINDLYLGLDNPLFMSIPTNSKTFRAICDNGIFIQKNDQWFIRIERKASCNITLFDEYGYDYRFRFRVKELPCPVLTIGGSPSNEFIAKPLLLTSAIIPLLYDFYYELFFKVENFKLLLTHPDGTIENFSAIGNNLTIEMKESISKLAAGSEVMIYDAEAVTMNTNSDTRCKPAPITLKIK